MKQVVPYAKFLVRAYRVKRDPSRHLASVSAAAVKPPAIGGVAPASSLPPA